MKTEREIPKIPEGFGYIKALLLLLTLPVAAIALTPIIYTVLWGVCGTKTAGVLGGFTLFWIRSILTDRSWLNSLAFSFSISLFATTSSMLLIALTDYSARFATFGYEKATNSPILFVLVFPQIVYGIALRYCLDITHVPAVLGLIAANIILVLPVQYLIVEAGRAHLSDQQLHAATVLGASTVAGLKNVYFPLMRIPLFSGWIAGFLMAFDELVIAMSIWDNPTKPVSKRMWELFGRSSEPFPAGIALILVLVLLLVASVYFAILICGMQKNREP